MFIWIMRGLILIEAIISVDVLVRMLDSQPGMKSLTLSTAWVTAWVVTSISLAFGALLCTSVKGK